MTGQKMLSLMGNDIMMILKYKIKSDLTTGTFVMKG